MIRMVPSLHIKVLFLFLYVSAGVHAFLPAKDSYRRKVSLELNPGLDPGTVVPPGMALLHARALGQNDTLHFVLCSGGAPVLLLVHTNCTHSLLDVDWSTYIQKLNTNSVKVLPPSSVQYSSALVFTRLWELDKRNETDVKAFPLYEFADFRWDDMNRSIDHTHLTAKLCGSHANSSANSSANPSLCIQFSLYESVGREGAWPSLLHNANSSQLHLVLSDIEPRSDQSQLALELQAVKGAGLQGRVDVHWSIDDEYTPSIFQTSEWVWPGDNPSHSGYSQWKPVAYHRDSPSIEDARPCNSSTPVALPHPPAAPIISAFFTHDALTQGLNLSFHTGPGDAQYISWTVLAGIGTPPSDFFSPLVMSIMAVGLGAPLLLLLMGGAYICLRKLRHDSAPYQPID